MKRIIITLCMLAVGLMLVSSSMFAAEEKKKEKGPVEFKIKGELIPHSETNDIKVLTEDYETITVNVDGKTTYSATSKSSLKNMEKEAEAKLPKGDVSFRIIDGKIVATKVNYKTGWKIAAPKAKKAED